MSGLFRKRRESSRAAGILVSSGCTMIPGIPPRYSRSALTAGLSASFGSRSRTSIGKTLQSTTRGTCTSAISATTLACFQPARSIVSTSPTRPSRPHAPLKATAVSRYALPRGNRFDAESLDYDRGNAIVIAKYLDGREAEIFSVPFDPTSPMARPAEPRSLGRLAGFTEPATGSDLHGDLSHLAICSSAVTRIYGREDVGKPGWKLLSEVRYPVAQIEGICWDGRDLVLVAEGGAIFRIAEKTWRAAMVRKSSTPAKGPHAPAGRPLEPAHKEPSVGSVSRPPEALGAFTRKFEVGSLW